MSEKSVLVEKHIVQKWKIYLVFDYKMSGLTTQIHISILWQMHLKMNIHSMQQIFSNNRHLEVEQHFFRALWDQGPCNFQWVKFLGYFICGAGINIFPSHRVILLGWVCAGETHPCLRAGARSTFPLNWMHTCDSAFKWQVNLVLLLLLYIVHLLVLLADNG